MKKSRKHLHAETPGNAADSVLSVPSPAKSLWASGRIILIYLAIALGWLFFYDEIRAILSFDPAVFAWLDERKPFLYVILTATGFFSLFLFQSRSYIKAIRSRASAIELLSRANERLKQVEETEREALAEAKLAKEELFLNGFFDSLTGLPNKAYVEKTLREFIAADPDRNRPFTLISLDVDNLNYVNELKGHETGDTLLCGLSALLSETVCPPDFAARIGGDDFCLLLFGKTDAERKTLVETVRSAVRRSWNLDGADFFITLSVGLSSYPEDGGDFLSLLRASDMAMKASKEKGKDRITVYRESMRKDRAGRIELFNDIRKALDDGEFALVYQPIYDLGTGALTGAESLIRWNHPEKGTLPPDVFIPLAEETGLIRDITRWVMKTVFLRQKEWKARYPSLPTFAFNVSARDFTDPAFLQDTVDLVEECGVVPKDFEIEVTESVFIVDMERTRLLVESLHDMGFQISLDDFGKGYSSLTYLQKMEFDILKIDRSFIRNLESSPKDLLLLRHVLLMAHDFGKKVVVEGLETDHQVRLAKELSADFGQGYFLARPEAPSQFGKRLSH